MKVIIILFIATRTTIMPFRVTKYLIFNTNTYVITAFFVATEFNKSLTYTGRLAIPKSRISSGGISSIEISFSWPVLN